MKLIVGNIRKQFEYYLTEMAKLTRDLPDQNLPEALAIVTGAHAELERLAK